jgi:pyruvate dehydrogenase E2 component (dihydrolipoamide acetyltransferase)
MADDRLFDFQLPDLGEGVVEGEVVKWLVADGQDVKADEPLLQVMTDKATVEIPSPRKGTVKQRYFKEGDIIPVGARMLQIELAEGESRPASAHHAPATQAPPAKPASDRVSPSSSRPAAAPVPDSGLSSPTPRPPGSGTTHRPAATAVSVAAVAERAKATEDAGFVGGRKPLATPAVRQLARELGVDLTRVEGSGPAGRVTREDVEAAARPTAPATAPAVGPGGGRPGVTFAPGEREQRHPIRGLRRKIAEKMVQSAFTAPHVTHVDEADMSSLVAWRSKAKGPAEAMGAKLSYLPFIIKATVAALKQFPHFNASWDEQAGEIVLKGYYHVGFGVATDQGLLVGVVKDADRKSLLDLARETQAIAAKVRDGKATLDELTGSTFTLSNFGSLGGLFATPLINYPEVAILGLGAIKQRPVVREGQIVARDMMYLALSFDHRIVDGADAVSFVNAIKQYLETPEILFLESV